MHHTIRACDDVSTSRERIEKNKTCAGEFAATVKKDAVEVLENAKEGVDAVKRVPGGKSPPAPRVTTNTSKSGVVAGINPKVLISNLMSCLWL
jgi:hypothetical protein